MTFRPVLSESQAVPTLEGAGVHLHRAFGYTEQNLCDPFLMMDDFRNDVTDVRGNEEEDDMSDQDTLFARRHPG